MVLSSAEVEYISTTLVAQQIIWLRRILKDVDEKQEEVTTLLGNNKSTISMTKNPIDHSHTKYIKIKYHCIRDAVEEKEVEVKYVRIQDQVADIFTKVLSKEKFIYFRDFVGIQEQLLKKSIKI